MTPADITAAAEFRAGLARRLAEVGLVPPDPKVGLVPPEPKVFRVSALPVPPAQAPDRKAA
jgi:hypothetical protein